jgi:putative transposase
MLPHEFPPWGTVHYYYRVFRLQGLWPKIHDRLREEVRRKAGRKPTPSAGILDSQSFKTAEKGGTVGYDAGKKISARKQHVLVDTLGLILVVVVHAANIQDRDVGRLVPEKLGTRFRRFKRICVDGGYAGIFADWARQVFGRMVEIVKRRDLHHFVILPKR